MSQHCDCDGVCGWRQPKPNGHSRMKKERRALSSFGESAKVARGIKTNSNARRRQRVREWGSTQKWNSDCDSKYFCILILLLGTWHLALKWGKNFPWNSFAPNSMKSKVKLFSFVENLQNKKKTTTTRTRCGSSVQMGEFSSRLIRPVTVSDFWYVLQLHVWRGCGSLRVPSSPSREFASCFSFSWHDSQHNLNTETAKLGQPRVWVLSVLFSVYSNELWSRCHHLPPCGTRFGSAFRNRLGLCGCHWEPILIAAVDRINPTSDPTCN